MAGLESFWVGQSVYFFVCVCAQDTDRVLEVILVKCYDFPSFM